MPHQGPDEPVIAIEVAYAQSAARQALYPLRVKQGTTVAEALRLSGVFETFPELLGGGISVGIHARSVTLDKVVSAGDRVEIYRPLTADPKDARRLRAQKRRKQAMPR